MKIKIGVFHNDDINLASVRLRSFYLFDYIFDRNIEIFRNINFIESFKCKIIHIHMKYKPADILKIIFYRILNKTVIFDLDDIPTVFIYRLFFCIAINLSSKISADNKARIEYIKKYVFFKNKIFLLRDVIDLEPTKYNKIKLRFFNNEKYNFFWTGHKDNFHSIYDFIELVSTKIDFNLKIFTNLDNKIMNSKKYININFYQWENNIAFSETNDCEFAIFNHSETSYDSIKSENKMVLAIAAGMIPFVSDTSSYRELAEKLEAELLIYKNFKEVIDVVKKLDSSWKINFIKKAQNYILNEYSNKTAFEKLMKNIS